MDDAFERRWDCAPSQEISAAAQALYALYDPEALIRFFASLWDGERGGFYYSHSARDHEGFDADIESTYQILNIIRNMGAADGTDRDLPLLLGQDMTARIVSFVQGMQSDEDGYFYHPQWRESSGILRVHRDQLSAIKILEWLGSAPKYATAIGRADSDAVSAAFGFAHPVPLFCYKHGELFVDLCARNEKISKKPCPAKD